MSRLMAWAQIVVAVAMVAQASPALALFQTPPTNTQYYDGCEAWNGAIGGQTLQTITPFQRADGDVKGSDTRARTGWRSCAFGEGGFGTADNIAVAEWISCAAPNDATGAVGGSVLPCATANRTLGAQQIAFALYISGAPSVGTTGWFLYIGTRACEDNVTTCSSHDWDDGSNYAKLSLNDARQVVVSGSASSTGTCTSTAAITTSKHVDVSTQLLESTPDATHYTLKVRIEDTVSPVAPDESISCVFNISGASVPAANFWLGWDKSVAGTGPTPLYIDDLAVSQTTVATSDFLPPVKGYWLGTNTTGGSAAMVTVEDVPENMWGGCSGEPGSPACSDSERLDSITQVPFTSGKYLCSCIGCQPSCTTSYSGEACLGACETIATRGGLDSVDVGSVTASENASGAGGGLSSYPAAGQGPIVAFQTVAYAAGPTGSASPQLRLGFRDGTAYCTGPNLKMIGSAPSNVRAYTATIHRDDSELPSRGACDGSYAFDCDSTTCRNSLTDYGHQLKTHFVRSHGTGESSLIKQVYGVAWYRKPTPLPATNTPTNTPTITKTPTNTRTPTITNTPVLSFTPTDTKTPTITQTVTKTATSGFTFTPSPTFVATQAQDFHTWTSLCRTDKCTFCAKSQTDPVVALEQARAASASCPQGVTFVLDRDFTAASPPTLPSDAGQKIGGLPLFSNLHIVAPAGVKIVGNGNDSLLHCNTHAPCSHVTITGGEWDGTAIGAQESAFNLYGISHLIVENATIRVAGQIGITYGGGNAVDVVLRDVTTTCLSGACVPRRDAGQTGADLDGAVDIVLTPTATPT